MKPKKRFWVISVSLAILVLIIVTVWAVKEDKKYRYTLIDQSSNRAVVWSENIQTGIVIKEFEQISPEFKVLIVSIGGPIGRSGNERYFRSILAPVGYKVVPQQTVRIKSFFVVLPHETSEWRVLYDDDCLK